MSFVFTREIIIGIAALGGVASVAAMFMRARSSVPPLWITRVTWLAYLLMSISIVLFIVRGLTPSHPG
jgi:apolipoprotein N-acyltransferase